MNNLEGYKDQILKWVNKPKFDRCMMIKDITGRKCSKADCDTCEAWFDGWLEQDYKEPAIDWAKVPVDTVLLVWDEYREDAEYAHYAGDFERGMVAVWCDGRTSWTSFEDDEVVYYSNWDFTSSKERKKYYKKG